MKTNTNKLRTYLVETVKYTEERTDKIAITIHIYVHDMERESFVSNVGPRGHAKMAIRNTATGEQAELSASEFIAWKKTVELTEMSDYIITVNNYAFGMNGDTYTDVSEYTYEVREMPAPCNRNKANLCLLEVYNKNDELLERKYLKGFQYMNYFAQLSFYENDKAKRSCRIVMNGVDVTAAYDFKTRSAYSCGYRAYTKARHTCYDIVFDKTHAKRITKAGIVPHKHGEKTEFKCCFCGETFSSPNARHYNNGVRPKFDEDGNPNYCCTKCFKHYVITTYVFRLQGVLDFRPDYEHIPRDYPDKYNAYLQAMSLDELDALIKKEGLRKLIPSGLSLWMRL